MTKISQLTATTTPVTNDEFALARSGSNFKLTFDNLRKGISSYINNTVFVDSTYGSDLTGALENIAKPYATITAAQTACVAATGQWTIVIATGTYVDTNLGANSMSYYFMPNVTLTSADNCFRDNGSSINFKVLGYGNFVSSGGSGEGVCVLTGATSIVYFEGNDCSGNDLGFSVAAGSKMTVRILNNIYTLANSAARVVSHASSESKLDIWAKEIESEYCPVQTVGGASEGTLRVNANKIIMNDVGSPQAVVSMNGGSAHVEGDLYGLTIGSSPSIYTTTGTVLLNIHGNIDVASSSDFSLNVGVVNIYGNVISTGQASVSGATVYFEGSLISSYSSAEAIRISTGTLRVNNTKIQSSISGSANNHSIVVAGAGTLILSNVTLVCDPSANSVYASSARNIKAYSTYSNYAFNVNITNLITGALTVVDTDVQ